MIANTRTSPAQMQRIADRLAGQRLLVTGTTGFLAKAFVEKLLRAVPTVGALYVLIRPRPDGMSAEQRMRREVIGSNAFDRLRAAWGPAFEHRVFEKLKVVSGDLTRPRLGLTEEVYRELTGQVTLVVNSAATVTFDERLDSAIALNIEGPLGLLKFAQDAGSIPYLHVSTAYVSGIQTGDIPETLLPGGHTVASYVAGKDGSAGAAGFDLDRTLAELRDAAKTIKNQFASDGSACRREMIDAGMRFAQRLGWNDTYTFTKWMAEQGLARDRGNVPLVIFRPAIIEGSYEEPAPGWIDGLRMADPLILAYGRGKLREFPADARVALDLIPVDFVANAMIATLPAGRKGPSLEVFHCGSAARNPLSLVTMVRSIRDAFRRRPMRDETGRPIRVAPLQLVSRERFVRGWERRLRKARRWRSTLKSIKAGQRWRRRLAAAEAQISQLIYFSKIYAPYTHLDCRYLDDRLRGVYERMPEADQRAFPFDVTRIDWFDYVVNRHVPGVRHFVLGAGTDLEAPMLAASQAVEGESPQAPPPMQVLAALRGESIFDVFENAARAYPSRIALQVRRDERWVRYTYADALAATGNVARRFEEHGLHPGDHVALFSENSPEWGITYLAAMRCGLAVVPLDPQLSANEVLATCRFADVRLICTGLNRVDALLSACAALPADDRVPVARLDASFVPPPGTSRDPGPDPVAVSGEALASIVFTSGTTVAPKGVMLRHRNFLSNARSLVQVQAVHADDQFLSVLPMYHVFEFTGGFLVPLANASTVTYVEQLTPVEILSAMQTTGTTVMMVVPRLLKLFFDGILRQVEQSGWWTRRAFGVLGWISERGGMELGRALFARVHQRFGGRLRMFVSGGSALPASLYHGFRRLGFQVCEGYGLTETAPVLTVNPAGGSRPGSVGLPLPEVELDTRHQDPQGVGELWVRGPNVMAGYYNNPSATAETIVDGWLRTGDLCRRDAEGYLYVTGRSKDIIVTSAGKNVYPDEVALHFAHLPQVKEVCVLAMPNPDGIGDSVDAVLVLDLQGMADVDRAAMEAGIRRAVAEINEKLPSPQRLANLHFWTEDLPKTSTLKVKRSLVARMLLAREHPDRPLRHRDTDEGLADVPGAATVSENEGWLIDLLVRLTKRPAAQIHPAANLLLDLGIDSLMKVELLSEVEMQFGLEIPEQVAARVGRVGDLLTLMEGRAPAQGKPRPSRRRFQAAQESERGQDIARSGATPLALLPFRWVARGGMGLFLNSYVRIDARGLEHLPEKGAFILAANHASHLDSPAIIAAIAPALRRSGRRCYIAGAEDYFFDTRLKALLFGALCDAIPFDRFSDGFQGLRRVGETLRRGQPVLLFPEGTRSLSGELQPFKTGVAVLAMELGVPIVPVHVDNTFELLPKGRRWPRPGVVVVTIGPALEAVKATGLSRIDERYDAYRALTERLQRAVEELERRQRAGVEDLR